MDKTKDNLILIGMPGSGKSTVGVLLAKALGMDFLDIDLVIQQREGALLQELVDSRGTEGFLDAEEAAVKSLSCAGYVIAPGGSAVCRPGAAEHLKKLGTLVYLRLSCEALTARLTNMATRGIAMEPGQTLQDVYNFRAPLYERYADLTVDADNPTIHSTVSAVLRALNAPKDVLSRWPQA
ncbi:MAG: shikimate kinase [Oscillospiraceae bacterium]|nr:shikimate kinase [Oscillospiraceae bacterium]